LAKHNAFFDGELIEWALGQKWAFYMLVAWEQTANRHPITEGTGSL
jgi:hypothetical protein